MRPLLRCCFENPQAHGADAPCSATPLCKPMNCGCASARGRLVAVQQHGLMHKDPPPHPLELWLTLNWNCTSLHDSVHCKVAHALPSLPK